MSLIRNKVYNLIILTLTLVIASVLVCYGYTSNSSFILKNLLSNNINTEEVDCMGMHTYVQKFVNSQERYYSLSAFNVGKYANDKALTKVKTSEMELVQAIYFNSAYLAQYLSTDKTGTLSVLCERTSSGNVYVYDLYSYKGKSLEYLASDSTERDYINKLKETYSKGNNELGFSEIKVTDLMWGKKTLSDKEYSYVLIEFKGKTEDGIWRNNYVLVDIGTDVLRLL